MEADIKLKDALQEGQEVNEVIQDAVANDEKGPCVEPPPNEKDGLMAPIGQVNGVKLHNKKSLHSRLIFN